MITLALRSLFEPAHRSQPRLQPAVVALDSVVGVSVVAMPGRRQQLLKHRWICRRPIGSDLDGCDLGRADHAFEEPVGSLGVSARRDEHVDDLPELVDRTEDIAPLAATFT